MSWDAQQRRRLADEKALLARYFPGFDWIDPTGNTQVVGWLHTNTQAYYAVAVLVPSDYPESVPPAYITSPNPLQGNGRSLQEASLSMHTLKADGAGNVKVCHHSSEVWTQSMTLYKVVMKVRLWLEAYEGHLQTGNSIDYYLKHMRHT